MPDRRFKPVPNRPVVLDRASVQLYHDARVIPDLAFWGDASQLVGFSDADPVGTLPDLSGSGYDAVISGGNRPLYVGGALNGLPGLQFDGVNDHFVIDAGLVDTAFNGITQGTLFVVFTILSGDGLWGLVEINGATDAFWNFDGNTAYMGVFRAVRASSIVTGQPTSGSHYHTVRSGPAGAYDYRRNGSLDGSAAENWGVATPIYIGFENVVNWLTGMIHEIRIYTRELSDTEVTGTENGLAEKWGL